MAEARLFKACMQPSAHMGCIKEGQDLVLQILTNHIWGSCLIDWVLTQTLFQNKNQKCLSCKSGDCGASMQKVEVSVEMVMGSSTNVAA
jgi:disulfide bond formation protein DsbB